MMTSIIVNSILNSRPNSSSFDPLTVPNLEGWYATDNVNNVVNGSNIMTSLKDKSANGRHMTLTTTALPTYTASGGPNNKPYITIDPTHSIRVTGLSIAAGTPISFYIVFKPNSLTGTGTNAIFDLQGDRDTGLLVVDADVSLGSRIIQLASGNSGSSTNKNLSRVKWNVVSATIGGAASKLRVNKEQASKTDTAIVSPAANVTQFGLGYFSLTPTFDFAEVIIVSGTVSAANDKALRDYLLAKYQPTDNPCIQYFGDSTTVGAGTTAMWLTWPNLVALEKNLNIVNFGVSSTTVYTAGVPGSNFIDIYQLAFDYPYYGQYICFGYGINDSNAGVVNTAWKAQYKALIQSFVDYGYNKSKMMISKPPAKVAAQAGRALVNQYIGEIASELGIPLCDAYTAFNNNGGDTLFADALHPNNAGNRVWADAAKLVLP